MKPLGERGRLLLLWLFAVALRLLFFWEIRHEPAFNLLMIDSQRYDQWARGIAAGDWLGTGVFYQAPLYPYLLSLVYGLLWPSPDLARLLQAVLGATGCVVLALAGGRFFSERTGLAAGVLLALYPSALFADSLIGKSSLDFFLVAMLLLLLARAGPESPGRHWFALGAVVGALALTRENALVLALVALGWLCATVGLRPGGRLLRPAAWLAAGLSLLVLPVTVRNRVVGGEFVLTSYQLGTNLYIGNNPGADGTFRPLVPGRSMVVFESRDATDLAERAVGRRLTPAEVSAYWTRRALDFVSSQPGRWLRLTARKALLLLNRVEVSDTYDQYAYGEWSLLLRTLNPVMHFGLLVPLAALGVLLTWPQRRRLWVLYAVFLVYGASLVVFFDLARFRYPLVPVMILFACAGAARARGWVREAGRPGVAAALAVAAAGAALANWPLLDARLPAAKAVMWDNLGVTLLAGGRHEDSLAYFRRAALLDPAKAEYQLNVGRSLYLMGRVEEALACFDRAVGLAPRAARYRLYRGRALSRLGRAREAIASYREALALDSSLVLARAWLERELGRQSPPP